MIILVYDFVKIYQEKVREIANLVDKGMMQSKEFEKLSNQCEKLEEWLDNSERQVRENRNSKGMENFNSDNPQ